MIALLASLLAMVQSPYNPPSYSCDGVTAVYAINYPYLAYTDLVITSTTAGGAVTTLAYTTDYMVNLASTSTTATLTLNSPATKCPTGSILKITRSTALTQPTSFKAQTNYSQTLHEQAYDRTEMQVQERSYQETLDLSNINTLLAALNSSGAGITSASTVLATGGTTVLTLAAWFSQEVSVKAFGALGISTDDTAAIQAAITYACSFANGRTVYIPTGIYVISSQLTGCSRLRIRGDGDSSRLKPTISNGTSSVLYFPPGSNFMVLENFAIISGINSTNFNNGTASAQQCNGITIDGTNPSGPFSARFMLSNIHVYGVKTAYVITGFIATLDNVWADYNEVGLTGTTLNSVDLNLRMESNRQDFNIASSSAILFRQFFTEGSNVNAVASTLDTVRSVTFLSPYFEALTPTLRSIPWLTVGGVTTVFDFKIIGMNVFGGSNMATGVYPIKLDNVVGAEVNGHFSDAAQTRKVLTTANTRDYKLTGDSDFDWFTDESGQLGPSLNYFPNGGFELWHRGFSQAFPTRATRTQETTIVRRGSSAMRVTATAGQNFNYAFNGFAGPAAVALRGRSVRACAWVWIPNITEFDETARTAFPTIGASSFNGATDNTTVGLTTATGRNAWNFICATQPVQSDATRIGIYFYVNDSATNATGNEYIVVDEASIVDANTPISKQMNGEYSDATTIYSTAVNGSMVLFDTAKPADTNQIYAVGDLVFNSNPTLGGPLGWMNTAAGSPGTWTAFGPIGIQQATLAAGTQTATVTSGCRAICTDTTNANAIKCSVAGTTLTFTGTGTDVINYFCF